MHKVNGIHNEGGEESFFPNLDTLLEMGVAQVEIREPQTVHFRMTVLLSLSDYLTMTELLARNPIIPCQLWGHLLFARMTELSATREAEEMLVTVSGVGTFWTEAKKQMG